MTDGPLTRALKRKRPLILDGAIGTELQRRGENTGLPLWSANALMQNPEAVFAIHLDYAAAGADILTTNTFRTTARTFRRAGFPDRSEEITALAVRLCCQARDQFPDREILVAGSIAPLEDCYRPDLVPSDAELRREHAELAQRLADEGVDFLLLETMNTIREAYAACNAARETGLETMVSFLCSPVGTLYSGEQLAAAVSAIAPLGPAVIGVNCVPPVIVLSLLAALCSASPLPRGVYANVGRIGGEQEGEEFVRAVSDAEYAHDAREWANGGAAIIGGCCGTTPAYIEKLGEIFLRRHQDTKRN